MRFCQLFVLVIFVSIGGIAQADPFEPPRGSELRRTLLNTLRPLAAYDLGAPIEFRVLEMLADGDVAFVRVMAQRPGGAAIDMAATPMVQWRYADPYEFDGPRFEAFFVRQNGYWQIANYGLGSTDVWWSGHRCDVYGTVLRNWGC